MRQNKLSQRLKSKLDSFGFDALIKGVSTLVEETEIDGPGVQASLAASEPDPKSAAHLDSVESVSLDVREIDSLRNRMGVAGETDSDSLTATLMEPREDSFAPRTAESLGASEVGTASSAGHVPSSIAAGVVANGPDGPTQPLRGSKPNHPDGRTSVSSTPHAAPEQLKEAIYALSCRLNHEAGRLASALKQHDPQEAGFYLAHVNQILELLHTIDARGDYSRQLGVENAPPQGRSWPLTAWTVVEFAESPFSALLPADADDNLVRGLIYSAWGISFAPA